MYYMMKHRKIVQVDPINWAHSFNNIAIRRIRSHRKDGFHISTVFLGTGMCKDTLFETMIFHPDIDINYMRRCETHRQALAMHKRARAYIKDKEYEHDR